MQEINSKTAMQALCEEYRRNNTISKEEYTRHRVKRGLRNEDGTGVMAGLTYVCNVHGYLIDDGDKVPDKGRLTYRGISVEDIAAGCEQEDRFGFEEVAWLLIFGKLPTKKQFDRMCGLLYDNRELPEYFPEDMIIKAPSKNIMNKLARSVLALYSYDDNPDDQSLENNMRQSIAEAILNALRPDKACTREEARLLDLCMVLHAEHGGGNNSTFTTRVLTSAGTDIYSAIGAAVGSLKGFRHGGANHRVRMMMDDIMAHVKDWADEEEVCRYLEKILRGETADGSGLIYGMGHAIYTLSDPRAVILKEKARGLAKEKGFDKKLALYELIERLSPQVFYNVTKKEKVICANVDFYSGLVYEMLGIPEDLFTPMFAVSRIAGWCAHRIEELTTGGRIMRPAYRALPVRQAYKPLEER